VLGYQTKDMTEVQDTLAYSFNIQIIKRMNNMPSYLNFNPTTFTKQTLKLKGTQSDISASLDINFNPNSDPISIPPSLMDIPDISINQNTTQNFALPRNNIRGNALKFSISSTAPKDYTPLISSTSKFTWTLSKPTPKAWTSFFNYGNNQLALVH
jgi:hypothetical protein